MNIRQIQQLLPHRYPFLLVDRVLEREHRKRIVCQKCVSVNEPFFAGHFPGTPLMPGVLIIEALAQAAGVLILGDPDFPAGDKLVLFTGIDDCRFRRPVVPGDVLRLEVEVLHLRPRAAKMRGRATVDGEIAAEATLLSALADRSGMP
ncbi:MAG: 3-hydroxyacyl-[acyl-carrier-protein] dehydratase FabZ [Acidobacteria bacterium]|nr:MAG: 3-hydroxyacyl-[acyl-carrier-protein] dehydratase FabZ [Acidobacteriota bacterium]